MSTGNDQIIQKLKDWGENRLSVRAMILTSTRSIPGAALDPFSDYDVIVVVRDVQPYYDDREWLEYFGKVLVLYRDPMSQYYDQNRFAYITQYEDGLKIDFTIWPVEILKKVVADPVLPEELDAGHLVLVDKDDRTTGLKSPTYRAYIPSAPDQLTFQTTVEEFFHETTYVAKLLWRDELMPAKYSLAYVMKLNYLRQMLIWNLEIENDWQLRPGVLGKGLKKQLEPEIWSRLLTTYVGPELEENWEALFSTIDLFRIVAIEVAKSLGLAYPHQLEKRIVTYLQGVRHLDRE